MFRRSIILSAVASTCFLVACAATLESEGLRAPATPVSARLAEGFSYIYRGGATKLEAGIFAGALRLELISPAGRYFVADAPSVWWKVGDKVLLLKKGGIWIPNDSAQLPRLYFYNHAGHFESGVLRASDSSKTAEQLSQLAIAEALRMNAPIVPGAVGSGLAMGIVDAVVEYDRNVPVFHPAPPSPSFGTHIALHFTVLAK